MSKGDGEPSFCPASFEILMRKVNVVIVIKHFY